MAQSRNFYQILKISPIYRPHVYIFHETTRMTWTSMVTLLKSIYVAHYMLLWSIVIMWSIMIKWLGPIEYFMVWMWNYNTNISFWLSRIVGSNDICLGKNCRKSGNNFSRSWSFNWITLRFWGLWYSLCVQYAARCRCWTIFILNLLCSCNLWMDSWGVLKKVQDPMIKNRQGS